VPQRRGLDGEFQQVALAGFGAGMFVGGRLGASKPSTAASASTAGNRGGDRLPAIRLRPRASGPVAAAAELAGVSASVEGGCFFVHHARGFCI